MTREEAETLADKREQHKPKSMKLKRWAAVHDSVKGWHVALIDNQRGLAEKAMAEARAAWLSGDTNALLNAATDAMIERCRDQIEREARGK